MFEKKQVEFSFETLHHQDSIPRGVYDMVLESHVQTVCCVWVTCEGYLAIEWWEEEYAGVQRILFGVVMMGVSNAAVNECVVSLRDVQWIELQRLRQLLQFNQSSLSDLFVT